jgi:hypothetical protein
MALSLWSVATVGNLEERLGARKPTSVIAVVGALLMGVDGCGS